MKKLAASALLLSLLCACGGGGGSVKSGIGALPIAAPTAAAQSKKVAFKLIIPNISGSSSVRRPHFVSPSALGANIAVTGATSGATASATVDLSPSSTACTTTGGQRSCTANVTAPYDNDTFTITLYDAAPVGSTIPSSAHVLGVGTVTQVISPTFTGSISVFVGGVISSIGLANTFASVPADGSAHPVALVIAPTDFGNNPIVAGSPDPYSNPITVQLTEQCGCGHLNLVLNGTQTTNETATLTKSTDTVNVTFDGTGVAGDYATITLSASGASTQTMIVSPMVVSSTSTFYGNKTLSLAGSALAVPMTAQEAGATSAAYTVTPAGCTNIASVGTVTTNAATATFSVTGGATANGTSCTLAVADGTGSSMTLSVINTPSGGSVNVPGPSMQEYQINPTPGPSPPASPQALIEGPDGRLWGSDVLTTGLFQMTTNGVTSPTTSSYNAYYYAGGLAVGGDGNVWAANGVNQSLDVWSGRTAQFVTSYGTNYAPAGVALGPDGSMWVTEGNGAGTGEIGKFGTSGANTQTAIPGAIDAAPAPGAIIAAPDGTMWFCDNGATTQIVSVSTSFTFNVIQSPPSGQSCQGLAAQSDGQAVWMTTGGNTIVKIAVAGTHAVTTLTLTGNSENVVAGADGAMYVDENPSSSGPGLIARIPIANPSAMKETPTISTPAGLTGIALGPDGRIWFGENGINQLGAFTP